MSNNRWWPQQPIDLARLIDHTLLRPSATRQDILKAALIGAENDVASVCINPHWVSDVSDLLKGTGVLVCTVVGFPSGAHRPQTIAFEADRAVREGAQEIDMVLPIGRVKMGDWEVVKATISTIKAVIGSTTLKVILETCDLTDEEITLSSRVSFESGAEFVKTSTGFGSGGATTQAVALMAEVAREFDGKVKASGGIRSLRAVRKMVEAGAHRIGTSSTEMILQELHDSLIDGGS